MIGFEMMDFDRPYAKTTSIDEPPHYLQDGKAYTLQGDEIVTGATVVTETQTERPAEEQPIEQPKKRGRKPTK